MPTPVRRYASPHSHGRPERRLRAHRSRFARTMPTRPGKGVRVRASRCEERNRSRSNLDQVTERPGRWRLLPTAAPESLVAPERRLRQMKKRGALDTTNCIARSRGYPALRNSAAVELLRGSVCSTFRVCSATRDPSLLTAKQCPLEPGEGGQMNATVSIIVKEGATRVRNFLWRSQDAGSRGELSGVSNTKILKALPRFDPLT